MWISVPTPVTSSTKHIDSGSSSSPASTWKPLTGIQENRCWLIARSSPARPSMAAKSTNPRTNAAPAARQASTGPQRFARRPPSSRIAAPTAGNASSSQVAAKVPSAAAYASAGFTVLLSLGCGLPAGCGWSVLQQVRVVHRCRPPGAEDRDDDRKSDHDFGGGHHHDEERHDLAIQGAVHPGEGHQRQVHAVEHQLHAHEHHDGVAPQQETQDANREQDGRQEQVVRRGHDPLPVAPGPAGSPALPAWLELPSSTGGRGSAAVPSGSSAGVSTASCRAKTPGLGYGVGCSPANRRLGCDGAGAQGTGSAQGQPAGDVPAAVISRALVASKAKT